MASENSKAKQPKESESQVQLHCGVIMPISGLRDSDIYTAKHWREMLRLIQEAAKDADFTCSMVSDKGPNDVIQGTIISNIYENEVVICDVSSRNPNVMLELGLRLSSKKPTIIIFDEDGPYPFDINTIRYIAYRRDMRYYDTGDFKQQLTDKIKEVYLFYKNNQYKAFLDNFKTITFEVPSLGTESETLKEFMERMSSSMERLDSKISLSERPRNTNNIPPTSSLAFNPTNEATQLAQKVRNAINSYVAEYNITSLSSNEMEKLFEFLAQHFPNVVYSTNMRSLIDAEVKRAVHQNRDNAKNAEQ